MPSSRKTFTFGSLVVSAILGLLPAGASAQSLMPLAPGNRWTYETSSGSDVTVIASQEPTTAPGWFLVDKTRVAGSGADLGETSEIYKRSFSWIGGDLFVHERIDSGFSYGDVSTTRLARCLRLPADKRHQWDRENRDGSFTEVVQVPDVAVETPAGKFSCVQVTESTTAFGATSKQTRWFAPGAGIVKEERESTSHRTTCYRSPDGSIAGFPNPDTVQTVWSQVLKSYDVAPELPFRSSAQ